MARTPQVTDAEIIAMQRSSEDLLTDMMDFAERIRNGHVERVENPEDYARHFALIARSAADMAAMILSAAAIQKQRDELNKLRGAA